MENTLTADEIRAKIQKHRMYIDEMWDPKSYQAKNDVDSILKTALEQDDPILEVPIQVTVRIPVKGILTDPGIYPYLDNMIYLASQHIKEQAVAHLNQLRPELVETFKERSMIGYELHAMYDYEPQEIKKTAIFDPVRAKKLFARKKEIERQYSYTDQFEYLHIESFGKLGVNLLETESG